MRRMIEQEIGTYKKGQVRSEHVCCYSRACHDSDVGTDYSFLFLITYPHHCPLSVIPFVSYSDHLLFTHTH